MISFFFFFVNGTHYWKDAEIKVSSRLTMVNTNLMSNTNKSVFISFLGITLK